MKYTFFKLMRAFVLITILSGALVVVCSAAGYGLDQTGSAAGFSSSDTSLSNKIGLAVRIGLGLIGFVFFGYTFYAGLRWMIARGNNEFVEKAQRTLEGSIIGLIIIVLAYALATFLIKKLGG